MPNTAETAQVLLRALSDEELARYGEIARDQAALELTGWGWQLVLAIAALATMAWSVVKWGIAGVQALGIEAAGLGSSVALGLGSALALGYSPYRRVRNWTLWNRHCRAVLDEQERRRATLATRVRFDVAG